MLTSFAFDHMNWKHLLVDFVHAIRNSTFNDEFFGVKINFIAKSIQFEMKSKFRHRV